MRLCESSVRRFKKEYGGVLYTFYVPARLYDKTYKANSRRLAEFIASNIAESEERLKVNVLIASEHPFDRLMSIIDRRDAPEIVPNEYDYVLMEVFD